ncbi:MAG: CBS domain-containing protein [Candidatus Omnitrophica bacterium]|nr:CBS domain-containing protein [Candidatus Omnitrophota bacterium]
MKHVQFVRDVMETKPVTVKTGESFKKLGKVLTEENLSNIAVVNEKGELAGIVSEQDVIKAMKTGDFMKKKARDIMTKCVISVKENDTLEVVAKIFTEKPFRRLPVVRNKKVVGSIQRDDIINTFMSSYY